MVRAVFILVFIMRSFVHAQSFEVGMGTGKLIFLDDNRSGNTTLNGLNTFSNNLTFGLNLKPKPNKTQYAKINAMYSRYSSYISGYYNHHGGAYVETTGVYVKKQFVSVDYYPGFLSGHTKNVEFGLGFSFNGTVCKYGSGVVYIRECRSGIGCRDTTYRFDKSRYSNLYHNPINLGLAYQLSLNLIKKDKKQLRLMVHSASNVLTEFYFLDGGLRMYRMNFNLIFRHEL